MKRLLQLLTVLSLLLFLFTATLTLRSFFVSDILALNSPGMAAFESHSFDEPPDRMTPHRLIRWRFVASRAGLYIERVRWLQPGWDAQFEPFFDFVAPAGESQWESPVQFLHDKPPRYPLETTRDSDATRLHFPGFQFIRGRTEDTPAAGSATYFSLTFPLPLLVLLAAILPTRSVLHWRRARRKRKLQSQNLCPTCHYDLRAHSPGAKCPECGTPIPPST